jgi:pyruvate/2-oxoglutarate dehydrogenase complex dihydrolipoamide dehydrogenase (E3) component
MAEAFCRLGTHVTLMARGRLLSGMSAVLAAQLREHLTHEGVEVIENANIHNITQHERQIFVAVNDTNKRGSHLLVASGRVARTQHLGLEAAGVTYDETGIHVDAGLRTRNRRVFALGDCTNNPRFTHSASAQASVVLQRMLFRLPVKFKADYIPRTVYTDPELAEVGKCHGPATITKQLHDNDRALADLTTQGALQLWLSAKGLVEGVAILAPHAGDLLAPWQLMMERKLKLSAMASLTLPYPTLSEISKRAAGAWFEPKLLSPKVRAVVKLLLKL